MSWALLGELSELLSSELLGVLGEFYNVQVGEQLGKVGEQLDKVANN